MIALQAGAGHEVTFAASVPYAFIAGLFLSNFPEAMSSSVVMKLQGWQTRRVLGMWTLLMLVVAVATGAGYLLGAAVPPLVLVGIEGLAAGAMLTMIASTMIPEAVQFGGAMTVGVMTTLGFLSAVLFKLLE